MHTRTTTAATLGLLTAGLLITGCSSSSDNKPPATTTPAVTAPAAAPPSVDTAGLIKACKTAVAAGLDTGSGAPQCNALSRSDYLRALREVDADAQRAFNGDTDAGADTATP